MKSMSMVLKPILNFSAFQEEEEDKEDESSTLVTFSLRRDYPSKPYFPTLSEQKQLIIPLQLSSPLKMNWKI